MSRAPLTKVALAAAVASTLFLTACGGGSDSGSDAAAATSDGPLGTVSTMFGDVTVPQPEDGTLDVVALGWSDAEMALSLGIKPVAVYDWQEFGADTKGVGPWADDLFGDVTPKIIERTDDSINYEQIQALSPDLILNTRSSNDQKEYERLSQIAPTVYAPTGTGAFATDWKTQMTSVSAALGMADDGTKIVADVQGKLDAAATANPTFKGKTVASVSKFGDAYGAYLPGDGRFDILGELGFVNNPAIEKLDASGFYATVSVENVKTLDADVAVVLPIGLTLAQATGDKLLASLDVVKDRRTVFLDPETDLGQAWSAASVLSIPLVLEGVVPDLAAALK